MYLGSGQALSSNQKVLALNKSHESKAACVGAIRRGHSGRLGVAVASGLSIPELATSTISSPSNAYVKHCVKLRTSRVYRQEVERVLVTGVAPLTELAAQAAAGRAPNVVNLFVTGDNPGVDGLPAAERAVMVTPAVMKKLAGLASEPTGLAAAAEVELPAPVEFAAGGALRRLLVLDGLQDPGNVGTLLRTALALGWQGVYCLPGCCDLFNDKALKAARGAAFRLPYSVGSWEELSAVASFHDMICLAAAVPTNGLKGESALEEVVASVAERPCMLVLGAEGPGLSGESRLTCRPVSVPMGGKMESLNVAAAGSILMYALATTY